jgi:hypothetical protein
VTEDGIQINTDYLDSFTYDGKTYTNDDLREHATLLFKNVIDAAHTGDKRRFEALMESLSMSHEKADKLWKKAKPALKWLSKLRVRKAARLINFLACGQQIDRKAAKEIGDTYVTQIIYDTFAAILDGSRDKHPEGSAYYKVFVGACAFPLKMVKRFHIKNGGLNGIQTRVATNHCMMILHALAMVGNHMNTLCKSIIVGEDSTSIAIAAQVLGREERSATYGTHCAGLRLVSITESVFSTNSLGIVLNHI